MGIINHDGYDWEYFDTPIVDTYITLHNNAIAVIKTVGQDQWRVAASFSIYKDLASYTAGRRLLDTVGVDMYMTTDELNNKKIRDHVYDALKNIYTNHTELPDD